MILQKIDEKTYEEFVENSESIAHHHRTDSADSDRMSETG